MTKKLLLITFLSLGTAAFAQKQADYKQKAEEIKKEIWGKNHPGFDLKDAPDSLKKESAVILARSFEVYRSSSTRIKFMIVTAASATRTQRITTLHERVKINDKSALQDYSTLEYQKKLDESKSMLVAKLYDVHNTFIGVKIVKPDGRELIVNTDEEVLVKNQQKDKQGKLAIPNLEVGDVIDYYINKIDMVETGFDDSPSDNRYVIFLNTSHPVLNLNLSFQYNSKVKVNTIYANGAPALKESSNAEGDQIFALQLKNVPKYAAQIWTSDFRQLPYMIVSSSFENKWNNSLSGIKTPKKGANAYEDIANSNLSEYYNETVYSNSLGKFVKDHYKGSKKFKATPLDSSMRFLYDTWKFDLFCSYDGKDMSMTNEWNGRSPTSPFYNASVLSRSLTILGVNHDVLIGSSKYAASLNYLDDFSPLVVMVRVNGPKPLYMPVNYVVSALNEVPSYLQGEKMIVATPTRKNKKKTTFITSETTIPVSAADKNHSVEKLQVSLDNNDMQKINITRTVTLTGALRQNEKIRLLHPEDIDRELTALVKGDPLVKRLKASQITKKMVDDYQAAFDKSRAEVKDYFTQEIKEQYETAPKDVNNYKVLNSGISYTNPALMYTASFALENFVKKAGANYILDAGKLIGSFSKLEEDQIKRSTDVYMPYARTFSFDIDVVIPNGYTVKGIEALSMDTKNTSGTFKSIASLNGSTLKISVSRSYNHHFEKAADWPKIVEILDAAYNFGNKKVLLQSSTL